MRMNPEFVATSAVLSMLLEVSATPKSGNVDRGDDFPDLKYEHFLASSASSYPVYHTAAKGTGGIGDLMKSAVERSLSSQSGGNVHFGIFLLLIPLCRASARSGLEELGVVATELLKETSCMDSLNLIEAFKLSSPRVLESRELDLRERGVVREVVSGRINLFELMSKSPPENIIARELTGQYEISYGGMEELRSEFERTGDLNLSIVRAYHSLLSRHPDPLIISKFGRQVAEQVRKKAEDAHGSGEFGALDEELLRKEINPGTIADLTASSIFLALLSGLNF